MQVLVGDCSGEKQVTKIKQNGWGRMVCQNLIYPFDGEPWGFDNGAYVDWVRDRPFDEVKYMARLWRVYAYGRPYLAVVPDIVGKGKESLEYSMWWRPRLPDSWPWYLAVQDGMEVEDVAKVLDNRFAGVFLGGTDFFKKRAEEWCRLAHRKQKLFHYGRCGTPRKVRHAKRIGADSIDSSFPLWTNERWDEFERTVFERNEQLELV